MSLLVNPRFWFPHVYASGYDCSFSTAPSHWAAAGWWSVSVVEHGDTPRGAKRRAWWMAFWAELLNHDQRLGVRHWVGSWVCRWQLITRLGEGHQWCPEQDLPTVNGRQSAPYCIRCWLGME